MGEVYRARDSKPGRQVAIKVLGVEVLPDNDDPGRQHTEQVAASCHAAGLPVKVVNLPDLPKKGDVSDWLNAGHTKAELIQLAKSTATYVPSAADVKNFSQPESAPVLVRLSDVEAEKIDWV